MEAVLTVLFIAFTLLLLAAMCIAIAWLYE